MVALAAGVAQLGNRRRRVGPQALQIGRIGPGPGDDPRAVPGADLVLEVVDDGVQSGGVDKAFFHQQRFKRLHPKRHVGGRFLAVVIVAVFVMIVRHEGKMAQPAQRVKGREVTGVRTPAMLAVH